MMNIVACASDNYTMQCGVLFYSVCKNNPEETIRFFVITDRLFTERHKDEIRQTIALYPNKTVEFIEVTDTQVDIFLQFENPYYTRHVFYRLLMPELLPNEIEKALYLDCDIVVRQPLSDLWNIDISEYAVGCVHDSQEGKMDQFNRLGFCYEKGYFNSGVLMVNLKYWRENYALQRFSDFIKDHGSLISMPDQDVLNSVFQDEKLFIPFTYNFQSGFMWKEKYMYVFEYVKYKSEILSASENPVILHFSGARPWIKNCTHPYMDEFYKYKAETIWKDEPLWTERKLFKTWAVDALRPLGELLGFCHVIPDYYDRTLKLK
jgi:lipopolysaccharide biosynthesis glycosyltransferase